MSQHSGSEAGPSGPQPSKESPAPSPVANVTKVSTDAKLKLRTESSKQPQSSGQATGSTGTNGANQWRGWSKVWSSGEQKLPSDCPTSTVNCNCDPDGTRQRPELATGPERVQQPGTERSEQRLQAIEQTGSNQKHSLEQARRLQQQQQQRLMDEQNRRAQEHQRLMEQQRLAQEQQYQEEQRRRMETRRRYDQKSEQRTQIGEEGRQRSSIGGEQTSLYDSGEINNYDDYHDLLVSATTPATVPTVRAQIVATESPDVWPTMFLFQPIPCAAFTDEVCYKQKQTLGNDKMNQCCDKGIYLTDLCTPNRCSNATTELCCMQKFLQAKFQCCENNSIDYSTPGDAFSRCCYNNFVDESDACCPLEQAENHWDSVNEICLPNVRMDLSSVRMSVNDLSDSARSIGIDLSTDRSWDYECKHGNNVIQFAYIPRNEKQKADG